MKLRVITGRATLRIAAVMPLAVYCITLTSCSIFHRDKELPQYYYAVEAPALNVPEGLSMPSASSALVITSPPAPLPQKEIRTYPPRVDSTSNSASAGSGVRWSAGVVYLLVKDTQSSVFRRLGFAVTRSGMSVLNTLGDNGYSFEYEYIPGKSDEGFFSRFWGKMAFWRDRPPNYSGSYQAVTQAEGESTRIYIKNADGSDADPDAAEHLLDVLEQRLG